MKMLKPMGMQGVQFNVVDQAKFAEAIKLLKESLFDKGATLFSADNLITWNRNLSFLRDPYYRDMILEKGTQDIDKSLVWRKYIFDYFAELALHREGDFLEIGCYLGESVHRLTRKIDFPAFGKEYFLYDLFEWEDGSQHTRLPAHDHPDMHGQVVARFADRPYVHLIKGRVPASFAEGFPEKVAFAHIDLNQPEPEAGALRAVLPRLSSGGIIIFDDYGWWGYSAQKIALDPIAGEFGLGILELPTGQAVLIKP